MVVMINDYDAIEDPDFRDMEDDVGDYINAEDVW